MKGYNGKSYKQHTRYMANVIREMEIIRNNQKEITEIKSTLT